MSTDTIAAISTGGANSGINIIRISGPKSLNIINNIFTNAKKLAHQKIVYGKIIGTNNKNIIDEVLVSYFKAPNSFTGEDVCEVNCHGGKQVTTEILQEILANGARLADPGEFSKIAFLNGKMDLSKAEGIIDLINAKTKVQSKIAVNQIEGRLYKNIKEQRNILIEMLANIEVNIDYPEYDYEELECGNILAVIEKVKKNINRLIDTYNSGKYLRSGINVAILGGPNSGKSTLLNLLSNSEKAIVTDIEGTTRDIVEETIVLDNMVLNLADTAGIRETEDVVEKIGIERSINIIEKVDIIIYVVDYSKGLTTKDKETLELIDSKQKPIIICLNKKDISRENKNYEDIKEIKKSYILTSFLFNEGIEELKSEIIHNLQIKDLDKTEDNIIVNERHKALLEHAKNQLELANIALKSGESLDIAEINIKNAADKLGQIIGENISEDIVNKIFEKFCLGK